MTEQRERAIHRLAVTKTVLAKARLLAGLLNMRMFEAVEWAMDLALAEAEKRRTK